MAPELPPDVLEQILIGFDVMDLIRWKRVCKSWHAFISSDRFAEAHLKLITSNNYRNDNKIDDNRVVGFSSERIIIGSSNGLVCLSPFHAKVLVANPMTMEAKELKNPCIPPHMITSSLCWGFGYDSIIEDYKVIVGYNKSNDRTNFQVLTLKSNVWKFIGEVSYTFLSNVGMLCNGALHWLMKDQDKNKVILSFNLSKEEFMEIPQPCDARYNLDSQLGIINECLCTYSGNGYWIMKNYNKKESWTFDYKCEIKHHVLLYIDYLRPWFFSRNGIFKYERYINAPMFVKSLVSPHGNQRPDKKRDIKANSHNDIVSWLFPVSPSGIEWKHEC